MKNRILAALLALVLGVPLYLLAADAAPAAALDNALRETTVAFLVEYLK